MRVVVVAFAPAASLAGYQQRQGLQETLVLSDPERVSYDAFELGRGSVLRVWADPRVWRRYAQLVRKGRRPEPAQEDTLQLGGDVLLGADGRIRWIFRSRGPEDRPTLADLEAAVAGA